MSKINNINNENNINDNILTLPMVAMRDVVVMPNMTVQFDVIRERSINSIDKCMNVGRHLFLTAQKDVSVEEPEMEDLYKVGTISVIKQVMKSNDGITRILVEGVTKAILQRVYVVDNALECECAMVENYADILSNEDQLTAAMRIVKKQFGVFSRVAPPTVKGLSYKVESAKTPEELFERIVFNIVLPTEDKQTLLEADGICQKLCCLRDILTKEIKLLKYEKMLQGRVSERIEAMQREQYLREMKAVISRELGEGAEEQDDTEIDYVTRVLELDLEQESTAKLISEIKRMKKMPPASQEAALISEYLDTCLDLPWNTFSLETCDCEKARKILDRDHYGLKKVKERILENIAVRQLSPEVKGQIICLVGPPGVGKTSIGRSIAQALGREYVRVSLGGVRDEADIRGHRKTYIGAMPGRIMDALRKCGTNNPVMLLDEIDKLTSDAHGDPSSALLEALDSEQNVAFRDHYIELPFDLSDVLFITTANTLDTIQPPLLDRMEVIELSSYTREEKYNIASKHLVPKQLKKNGLKASQVRISASAIYGIIDFYTREAGVRKLERAIASLCRKAAAEIIESGVSKVSFTGKNLSEYLGAPKYLPDNTSKKDAVGEVNGLAWTSVGGVLMPLEVIILEGKGVVEATGSLGDVMKESAKIAVSYCRSVAKDYGIDSQFYKNCDIHIHAPEGAVQKDGPSAGVTLVTALVSALSSTPVRHDIAMTGEITLTGKVLAIGGLREKTMAAYKDGIRTVIIPKANKGDLDELDDKIREEMNFVFAEKISDVLDVALVQKEKSQAKKPSEPNKKAVKGASDKPRKKGTATQPPVARAKGTAE